ncbi:uncharacterized protein LOC110455505 [Mizuhopecten yessoensis]|uniref:C3 and PZP-like alpha-2-macroglobulin domain-containing protein 8 n=1 Tax=Mizuhopecten yessoensis TaxID=6573 RepID=A0A210QD04_MIZYE|nr:uncharacterized protein LOC110455505 [Mizuhopecten yessoensis]OWF46609.1 C3 and PZP-like alpha-2-macroglobulin domain-containing protein 8 [Mizuhopecten yessoensis]
MEEPDISLLKMADSEEIVMTAAKRDGKAIMRLERTFISEIDKSKVHHVAGGSYKGILINKTSAGLVDTGPAEGRLEFLAYLVNEGEHNQSLQDHWTLSFWFRGTEDGLVKKNTYTDYFRELMNPADFPKDYIGFIKKALVLLREYSVIQRVELQVQQTQDHSPEDAIPPIRSFTTVVTPAANSFRFVPEVCINQKSFITFKVKAACDVRVVLSSIYGDVNNKAHEIVIGAEGNTKSYIRESANGPVRAESLTMNIVSEENFRYFWINWAHQHLEVGRGAQYGHGRFLRWHVLPKRQFKVNCLAVATSKSSKGHWEFAELLADYKEEDPEVEAGRIAKRARIREQYMWLARKYRMLHLLEDAFPNVVKIEDLVRKCKIHVSDPLVIALVLAELQERGLIKEVVDGHWMRKHGGGPAHKEDEVKLVKVMPVLSSREQPNIAIVTTLFCEKLAVDAMIENRTTFVKCKTEGESQVYTIGRIGKHRVVSTKLPCTPGDVEASNIAAGNSVTRLLGTFSKVEHVFLVGVGGGVLHQHDPDDPMTTDDLVTLGDVVVSMPSNGTNAMYTKCYTREKVGKEGLQYSPRTWHSHDDTLRRIVKKLNEKNVRGVNPLEHLITSALEQLNEIDSKFQKPSIGVSGVETTEELSERGTTVVCGAIGSVSCLDNDERLRMLFAKSNEIKAFDKDFEAVLESLEGNRNESYLMIRGIADFQYGGRKEWQPYASLVAAVYMKTIILALNE